MKKYIALALVLVALLGLVSLTAPTASAGTGPHCWSDPAEGPIGTMFYIECTGFTPNTHLWSYMVQPDGAAASCLALSSKKEVASSGCEYKTDETGSISTWFDSSWNPYEKPAVGTWTVVYQQLGPGLAVVGQGEARFRITGGTEGVSGAHVWMGADAYKKGEWFTVNGSGFAPNEIVSLWFEFPNGDCSNFTVHYPPHVNYPFYAGLSVLSMSDVKADGNGEFSTGDYFGPHYCEGNYRFVARGNTSGYGGEAWAAITGNAVATNAWLWSDKTLVAGMGDTISFTGSGYGADESVTCWLRTPQNQAVPVMNVPELKTNGSGEFSFSTWTGSYYPAPGYMAYSEGALGVYALTCRGNLSGATGIAEFTVTGGTFDP